MVESLKLYQHTVELSVIDESDLKKLEVGMLVEIVVIDRANDRIEIEPKRITLETLEGWDSWE